MPAMVGLAPLVRISWAIVPLATIAQGFPACHAAGERQVVQLPAGAALLAPPDLYVAADGSDTHSGRVPERPLRTLGAAAARAGAGTTVHVGPGTYHEKLVTRSGGSPGRPLEFVGQGAVVDGSRLPGPPERDQNVGVVELRHPHVRFAGFTVRNAGNTGIVLGADHLTVEDCEVAYTRRHAISTDTGHQVAAGGRIIRHVALRANRIHDAVLAGNGYGQAISLIADEFEIAGNELYANRDIAIDVWLGARHGAVRDNHIHDNAGQTAIYVDGAEFVRIHGNRIHHNKHGIGVSSEDGRYATRHVWIHDNLVYDNAGHACFIWDRDVGAQDVLFAHNTLVRNGLAFRFAGRDNTARVISNLAAASGAPPESAGSGTAATFAGNVWLAAPVGFEDAERGDFRLTASSPAIDRGAPVTHPADDLGRRIDLSRDHAGRDRTADGRPDAGALER
ncbi:MAG: right-handed parallel beta-helix repeat-containing protein [Candidatus Sericytochromatia bacterium]|nr:right-handed parallel beta-helix repeat-containing protein [Candidatus Tanganyikabacteria bacterium]